MSTTELDARVQVRMTSALRRRIVKQAKDERRPEAQMIRVMCEAYLKAQP
jgi:hypothetical protein